MVVDVWVIAKKIAMVEVVDENYLMVVQVAKEDYLMNVHAHFDMYRQLGFDDQIWETAFWFIDQTIHGRFKCAKSPFKPTPWRDWTAYHRPTIVEKIC